MKNNPEDASASENSFNVSEKYSFEKSENWSGLNLATYLSVAVLATLVIFGAFNLNEVTGIFNKIAVWSLVVFGVSIIAKFFVIKIEKSWNDEIKSKKDTSSYKDNFLYTNSVFVEQFYTTFYLINLVLDLGKSLLIILAVIGGLILGGSILKGIGPLLAPSTIIIFLLMVITVKLYKK